MNSQDLYERLLFFAKECLTFSKTLPRSISNIEYGKQLIRSSGSVGANYIEAVEALSKKDFIHRLRISRKEAKESTHWLLLIQHGNSDYQKIQQCTQTLIEEAQQLIKILSASVTTVQGKMKNNK